MKTLQQHTQPKLVAGKLISLKYAHKKIRLELAVLVDQLLFMEDVPFQYITPYTVKRIKDIQQRIREMHKALN